MHECEKCKLFDNKVNNCTYESIEDKTVWDKYFRRAPDKSKKFTIGKVESWEKGFHWELSDDSIFVERNISFIRKCSYGVIVSRYLNFKNKKILEIGPRYIRSLLRKQLNLNNCEYYSLQASERELKRSNTVKNPPLPITKPINVFGYISKIDEIFQPNFFDVILSSQTFEHWREEDVCEKEGKNAYNIGLSNCHKLLKPGGLIIQDAPIYHHGDDLFFKRDLDGIRKLFDSTMWADVKLSEWGKKFAIEKKINKWVILVEAKKIK